MAGKSQDIPLTGERAKAEEERHLRSAVPNRNSCPTQSPGSCQERQATFGLFEGKKYFDFQVNWIVVGDRLLNTTQDFLDETGWSPYNFTTGGLRHIPWDYYLEFTATKEYKYRFNDESGDGYPVNSFITGITPSNSTQQSLPLSASHALRRDKE
jgi:hypothetical protein